MKPDLRSNQDQGRHVHSEHPNLLPIHQIANIRNEPKHQQVSLVKR